MHAARHEPIAIVGIGCRFPGADSLQEYWKLLRSGGNAIRDVPEQRWSTQALAQFEQTKPGSLTNFRAGFLEQIDRFDWRAFRLSPREAKHIDPQHRLLLELAWEALEDAGIPFSQVANSDTSVYLGISRDDFQALLMRRWSQINDYTATGSINGFAAARLSHFFGLKGPSMTLDTSCASSLTALSLGCQSLWAGHASLALVGGVSLMLAPESAIMVSRTGLLATDSQTKALASDADGFSPGEGAGLVVLKPLSKVGPTDRVYALLHGVAINHNGRNEWMTAPDQQAQEALLSAAYADAGIEPAEIDYIELHGTGFKRGDQIETDALEQFFACTTRKHACLIGSVKTNIGHLEAASGMASLIKVALSLYHREIPPTLNIKELNPGLALHNLAPANQLQPWPQKEGTPTAGVTTTALNGTNVHAVLTAHAARTPGESKQEGPQLFLLSGHTPEALSAQIESYRHFLPEQPAHSWQDICYTASVRREHHPYRTALIASSPQEAAARLELQQPPKRSSRSNHLTFLFTDTGVIEPEERTRPAYQQALAEYNHIFQRLTGTSLSTYRKREPERGRRIEQLFQQLALVALWRSLNIAPDVVAWSGSGQLAAACVAEALTVQEALQICLAQNALPSSKRASRLPLSPLESLTQPEEHNHLVLTFSSSPLTQDGAPSTLLSAQQTLEALAQLYTYGYRINWQPLYPDACSLVSLPPYSWQRERLWPEWLDLETINYPPQQSGDTPSQTEPSSEASLEEALIALWTEALGYPELDRDANFFTLGGHSLLAAQLLARIQQRFNIQLTLSQLLQAPTPALCAATIALSREQPEEQQPLLVTADPANRYAPFPLTEVQQGYWIGRSEAFEISNVGNHAYVEVTAPAIDFARFDAALQALLKRHDMLRAILLPDGQQQVLPEAPPMLSRIIDLSQLAQAEQEEMLLHFRQQMDHQILPLDRCPAFELFVIRLDNTHFRLHLSVESIFFDAWSMNLLLHEFLHFYHYPDKPLPELELTFRDYIFAEQEFRQSELYRRSQAYWNERIPQLPQAPELPLVHSNQTLAHPRFVHRSARLTREQWQRIKARAAQAGMTNSSVLLTAFAAIIAAWSKSPRFSINLSIFNRLPLHPQIHEIVGDFTSLIIVGMDLSQMQSFEQKAREIQKQLWEDLDHRYYSGIHVLRELARRKGDVTGAVMPIVFTSFLIQDTASPYPPLWQETLYCVTQTPQVWLDHQVHETAGELIFHWESVDELFPPGLIDAMFEAYCQLLNHLAAEDDGAWQEVPRQLVSPEQLTERQRANATDAPVSDGLLHTLFIEQALKQPDALAVITPERKLTYRQVYTGMMQLATQLRTLGASPDHLVAVVMEKGWEQVVAVLAILQAGAAYLPVDPHLPTERLHYLLNHGKVTLALTQSRVDERGDWPPHVQRIQVDTLDLDLPAVQPLDSIQSPENLAYVIYTSGSTGLPKGVMIDHRGAVNTILDINSRFKVRNTDRVFALSALNFDLSVYDIFGLLAAGGAIVIPPDGSERNPAIWLEMLQNEQVTLWNSVPTLLHMLAEFTEGTTELRRTALRLALLSGDWIPLVLPEQLHRQHPDLEIISLGGATEASIWSILYPINGIEPDWKSIPYGRPMLNQRFHVLNHDLEPAPTWVPGELYIAGIGLAKGYWRDEEKTQERFFTHPRTGERLYKTGDLGRYLPDGNIEFLGRADFQVKIQGHRIELGEIEETCIQHPEVQAAIATAATDPKGEKRLVLYVVPQQKEEAAQAFTPEFHSDNARLPFQRLEVAFGQSNIRQDKHFPVIQLTANRELDTYRQRVSYRSFLSRPIPLSQFSDFLATLSQVELEGLPKYRYPSAGGIYPVQLYITVKPGCIEGLEAGVYYYNPQKHQLYQLSKQDIHARKVHGLVNQPIFDSAAFSLFLIGRMQGIQEHYGARAHDFCLLEAGYMSQLLMTEAPRYNLGLCPIGDLDFTALQGAFALEDQQVLLHTLLGGSIDPASATGWSLQPSTNGARASVPDLRERLHTFLKQKLPQYMLPASIILLDTLPLTANGKVDRKNLPTPDFQRPSPNGSHSLPTTGVEKQIASVWQELLPAATIGIHDSFFDLGGNSLLMVRAYTRLRQLFHTEMSIVEMFFQHPTIQTLANALTNVQPQQDEPGQHIQETHKNAMRQQRNARRRHRLEEDKKEYV
uniref:Non-ribosomal peptide synthetase n=1 Tax=Thermosporothrix sp. COM3 TaxID=2490863 RepID=A0A455SLA1_9CHLR|nr:hypothetical protein KTC_28220 [Thermosporothrix sp. COM3]